MEITSSAHNWSRDTYFYKDMPIDEFGLALSSIQNHYRSAFERNEDDLCDALEEAAEAVKDTLIIINTRAA